MTSAADSAAAPTLRGDVALVDTYLQLCEDREIDKASTFLDSEVRLEFPGNRVHSSLKELFSAAVSDYRWVRKHRNRYFEGTNGDDSVVVSIGSLYGVDLDGQRFDNVRYIDTFVIQDGLIKEQLVWNDLAKHGIGRKSE